jgi:hypothetical protein
MANSPKACASGLSIAAVYRPDDAGMDYARDLAEPTDAELKGISAGFLDRGLTPPR